MFYRQVSVGGIKIFFFSSRSIVGIFDTAELNQVFVIKVVQLLNNNVN